MISRREFLALPLLAATPTPRPNPDIEDIKKAIEILAGVVFNLAYIIDYNAAVSNARLKRLEKLIEEVKLPDKWQT